VAMKGAVRGCVGSTLHTGLIPKPYHTFWCAIIR